MLGFKMLLRMGLLSRLGPNFIRDGTFITLGSNYLTSDQANFSNSHKFSPTATAKIGPDTNSLTFVLVTARFWP